jgi:hypothetical protein
MGRIFRTKGLSAIRDLRVFVIAFIFNWFSATNIQLIFVIRSFGEKVFGYLAKFRSVIWRIFVQLFGGEGCGFYQISFLVRRFI